MAGMKRMKKAMDGLIGKRFPADSLRRELDRVLPDAIWDATPTRNGVCLFTSCMGMYSVLMLDRTGQRNTYRVRKAVACTEAEFEETTEQHNTQMSAIT